MIAGRRQGTLACLADADDSRHALLASWQQSSSRRGSAIDPRILVIFLQLVIHLLAPVGLRLLGCMLGGLVERNHTEVLARCRRQTTYRLAIIVICAGRRGEAVRDTQTKSSIPVESAFSTNRICTWPNPSPNTH